MFLHPPFVAGISQSMYPQFIVGFLTLAALGIYTYYTSQQVSESDSANTIARQALGEANKPYVMFSSLWPNLSHDKNGNHIQAGVIFTNFSNSPALNTVIYMCKPIIRDNPNPPPYKCDLADPATKTNAIGPKQPISFLGPILSDTDLDATKDEKKAIYVLGYLKYEDKIDVDPYGNQKRRVTSFCARCC